jgi:O-antigen/teichoic acid export membrane protein
MSFRTIALIEIAAGITGSVTTLALAWRGYGVWSLVAGILAAAATRTVGLLARGTRVTPDFDFRGLAHHLSFGGTLLLGRLGYLITTQADVAIASRLLPREAVGHYAVALQLATLPMQKLMGLVNQVTLPAVARLQDDLPRAREGVLKAVSLMTLGSVPMLWGISAVAPELIRVLLGDKWQEGDTADVIRIIALTIPARMIWAVLHTAAIGLGSKATDLVNTLVSVAVLPLAFLIGAQYGGIVGIALGWLIGIALVMSVTLPRASRSIGVTLTDIARQAAAPVLCGVLMYAAVIAARSLFELTPGLASLLLLATVGAGVYIGAAFLFARRHIAIARGFMSAARHG